MTGTPANETRGEVSLNLDGADYTLRPSYEAIDAFERATGKGLVGLFKDASEGALPLREAATIVTHCIRAQGRATSDNAMAAVNERRIAELIQESEGGVVFVMLRLQRLLLNAASGGYTASGEVKAATGRVTPDAA